MNEIFVPLEIALKLKEIEFNEKSKFFYMRNSPTISFKLGVMKEHTDGNLLYHELSEFESVKSGVYPYIEDGIQHGDIEYLVAPTWEQVFKWFREIGYLFVIGYDFSAKKYNYKIVIKKHNEISRITSENYPTYEQARENLALELIELYKKQNNE